MKTTNVILIGVVGVGAVGAYMYMKNKKAQDNLLSGSLPATTLSATPLSGTPPTETTPVLSTTSDGVSPSDANLNLANATVLVGQRAILQAKIKAPLPSIGRNVYGANGFLTDESKRRNEARAEAVRSQKNAQTQLVALDKKLANLGYKIDSKGALVKI